jgi:hypothetical protein
MLELFLSSINSVIKLFPNKVATFPFSGVIVNIFVNAAISSLQA